MTSNKRKIGTLVGGIAYGGLAFCGLNDVDADIVRSSDENVLVELNGDQVGFDVNGDGVVDILATNQSSVRSSYLYGYQGLIGEKATTSFGYLGTVSGSNQLRAFNTGVGTYVVGPGGAARDSFGYIAVATEVGSQWDSPSTNNFTFQFLNDDTGLINYGWGTLQYNGVGEDFTIAEVFYDNSGNSITVGQEPAAVPEPSSLALLGLGAVGLAGFRRKRSA